MYILSFDVGTTAVKSCLFGEDLSLVAQHSSEYQLLVPAPDIVELNPDVYWRALIEGAQSVMRQGVGFSAIGALCVTTQGETLIPIGRDGSALTNAMVWLDARAGKQAEALNARLPGDLFYQTAGLPELSGATPIAKLMWIREELGDVYERTHAFLLLEDYLIYRLTGVLVSEHSLLSSTGYFDIRRRAYATEILKAAGIDAEKLPQVAPSGQIVGGLMDEAARALGLLPGVPVVTTAMDQICGMIGAGNTGQGVVTETTGTCLTVGASVTAPRFDSPARPSIYAHFDDGFVYLPYNPTAAIVLKWFRDEFFPGFLGDCAARGVSSYDELCALASAAPPGVDGMLLLPHFAGKLVPDGEPLFKGAFVGVGLGCTRAHFVRSILEGVGFMLRENIQLLSRLGIMPNRVVSMGGGSNSDIWCQIKADILDLPIDVLSMPESASLGAAALALLALGDRHACKKIGDSLRFRARFVPNGAYRALYDRQYARYLSACRSLGAFYQS